MSTYVILMTDEDGTEHAYGPLFHSGVDRMIALAESAFPNAHTRAVLAQRVTHLRQIAEEQIILGTA